MTKRIAHDEVSSEIAAPPEAVYALVRGREASYS